MKVTVLGSGAWGTAIATVLAHNHHEVVMWTYEEDVVKSINQEHINAYYLPDMPIHNTICATTNKEEALQDAEWVFEAVPVKYMRSVLKECVSYYNPAQKWVVLSKGIEKDTCLLPVHILEELFGKDVQSIVLAGPSFAKEVVAQQLTSVSIASKDMKLCNALEQLMETEYFTLEATKDVRGVQLCAALKNVVALGMGLLEGLGCQDNTKALFFARIYRELRSFIIKAGGDGVTMEEPAGLGDLVLTAFGAQSKNLAAGKAFVIGEGGPHERAVPESLNTIVAVYQIYQGKQQWGEPCPMGDEYILLEALYDIVSKEQEPAYLLEVLS